MNQSATAKSAETFNLDQDVDLFEYLHALFRHKYKIAIGATLGAAFIFGMSLLAEPRFGASTLVAVNINTEPGGVDPSNFRSSDTLGLLEHDFIIDAANAHSNELDRLLATMQSMPFSVKFMEEENLLPYLFRDAWDETNELWLDDFQPDLREATIAFNEIRSVTMDDETGLLSIYFSTNNPKLSADLCNAFVQSFNRFMKARQSQVIAKRREFLNLRLTEIQNVELHRSIFRMIETQLAAESLLSAREDYPLEVIQAALPPLFKNYPQRKKWTALAFIGFLMLGFMSVIGAVILSKLIAGLKRYQSLEEGATLGAQNSVDDYRDQRSTQTRSADLERPIPGTASIANIADADADADADVRKKVSARSAETKDDGGPPTGASKRSSGASDDNGTKDYDFDKDRWVDP